MKRGVGAVFGALVLSWASSALAQSWQMPPVPVPPPPPAGAKAQQIAFTRAVVQLRDGQPWATMNFGLFVCIPPAVGLKWAADGSEMDPERFGAIFREELAGAGFASGEVNLFEEQDSSSNLQIAVLIKDMKAEFCGEQPAGAATLVRGKVLMSAEWQLYDTLERKILARIPITSGGETKRRSIDGDEQTIFLAYRNSVRGLLASDQFRAVLLAQPTTAPPAPDSRAPLTFVGAPTDGAKTTLGKAAESVVAIFAGAGSGSGFLISRDGYVLTNQHVVGSASKVKVRWSDGSESMGEVLRVDAGRDVALVKTDPTGRAPLALRKSGAELGETVFAVGTPLNDVFLGTMTRGIVSAGKRTIEGRDYIQSDVTVNPGNSGGPLLDERGSVLGITVLRYSPDGAPSGINLFIPVGEALKVLALQPAG